MSAVMHQTQAISPSGDAFGLLSFSFIVSYLITDNDRNLLLPTNDYRSNSRGCTFYSLPWATTESPELLFDNFSFPLMVESNQELQIWFSEDLFRWGDSDNGLERTCVAVYGLYV